MRFQREDLSVNIHFVHPGIPKGIHVQLCCIFTEPTATVLGAVVKRQANQYF